MDERMRFVIRLKDGEGMASLCREFNISRKTGTRSSSAMKSVAWRVGGARIIAMLLSPLLFFVLNYLAVLTGYDPHPHIKAEVSV